MRPKLSDLLSGGGGHRERPERKDVWKVVLAVVLFFGTITLYVLEFPHFSRTFAVEGLIQKFLFIGILFGIILGFRFSKPIRDTLEKTKIFALMIFFSVIVLPLIGSLTNRLLSFQPTIPEEVEFVELKAFAESRFGLTEEDLKNGIEPSGYYLFFVRNDKIERISLQEPMFETVKRSEMIRLPIKKGLWGHDVVIF